MYKVFLLTASPYITKCWPVRNCFFPKKYSDFSVSCSVFIHSGVCGGSWGASQYCLLSMFAFHTIYSLWVPVFSPHMEAQLDLLSLERSLYVNKCLSRSWTNGLFFIQGNWQLGHFQTFLGRRTKTTVISACEMFPIQLDLFRGLSGALVTFFQLPWGPGRMSL